jgi:hypothetical protein
VNARSGVSELIITGKVCKADQVVAKIKHGIDVLKEHIAHDPECEINFERWTQQSDQEF